MTTHCRRGAPGDPGTGTAKARWAWLEDVFAVVSGLLLLALLIGVVYLLLDLERLAAVWVAHWPALVLFAAIVVFMTTIMWLWMMADCAVRLGRGEEHRLVSWLAVMAVISPTAWPYYFIERRPRRRS